MVTIKSELRIYIFCRQNKLLETKKVQMDHSQSSGTLKYHFEHENHVPVGKFCCCSNRVAATPHVHKWDPCTGCSAMRGGATRSSSKRRDTHDPTDTVRSHLLFRCSVSSYGPHQAIVRQCDRQLRWAVRNLATKQHRRLPKFTSQPWRHESMLQRRSRTIRTIQLR